MREFVRRGIALDVCQRCGTTWYDGDELAHVVGHPVSWGPPASLSLDGEPGPACPRCGTALESRRVAKVAGTSVEVCARCGGVLLDEGTLPRLQAHANDSKQAQRRAAAARADDAATNAGWTAAVTTMATQGAARTAASLPSAPPEGPVRWLFAVLGLPVEEHGGVAQATWALWGLLAAIAGVYALGVFRGEAFTVTHFAMVPSVVLSGAQLSTVVSSMFGHAGLLHLLGNLYFLYLVGDDLEVRFGSLRFLGLYLGLGLAAQAAVLLADPSGQAFYLGASGAIAGLMGLYMVLFPSARILQYLRLRWRVVPISMPAWVYFLIWFGAQLLGHALGQRGVAWWAHIGGFLAGVGVGVLARARRPARVTR